MGWYLPKSLLKNTCQAEFSTSFSRSTSFSACSAACTEYVQRTRGPFQSLKNISDQVLYKITSRIQGWRKSHFLRFDALIASPIITYHPCHPTRTPHALAANSLSSSVTPWPFRHCFAQESAKPTFAEISNSGLRRLGLDLSSQVEIVWFIIILFWTVSSGGLVWWMDGSLWPPTTCAMTLVGIIRFYTCLNLILWIIRFWGLACQKSKTVLLTVIPKYHHHSPSWWGSLQSLQAPFFQTPGSVSGQGTHENVPSGVRNQSCVA